MSQHSVQSNLKSVQHWGVHHFPVEILTMADSSLCEKWEPGNDHVQQHPGLLRSTGSRLGEGIIPASSVLIRVWHPVLAPNTGNTMKNGPSSVEGHQDGQNAGALTVWGRVEGVGLAQPEEETASGGPHSSPLVPTQKFSRRWSKALYRGVRWKDKRQRVTWLWVGQN